MKYPLPMRIFHWTMSIIVIGMLTVGIYMAGLPDDAPYRMDLYFWHKSFGVTILVLVLLRILVRTKSTLPPPSVGFKKWEYRAALLNHKALYLFLVMIPICGYMMSTTYVGSKGINFFDLFIIPGIFPQNDLTSKIFKYLHNTFAYTLLAILVIHVLAVLKHRIFDKTDILKRMI